MRHKMFDFKKIDTFRSLTLHWQCRPKMVFQAVSSGLNRHQPIARTYLFIRNSQRNL